MSETTIRSFRETDAQAAVDLINLCHEADGIVYRATLQRYSSEPRDPSVRRDRDYAIAESGGSIVALSELHREKGARLVVPVWVHPAWRASDLPQRLVQRALTTARSFSEPALDIPVRPVEAWKEALVKDMAFSHVRTWWRMRIELTDSPAEPVFPAGISVRTFVPGQDEVMLTNLINETFADHWGEGQHTLDEVEHDVQAPYFDPALLLIAENAGQPVGYTWSWINHELNLLIGDPHGYIADLGVVKAFRGRGVGRALLLQGLHEIRRRGMIGAELEVDGPNASAKHLYESVGFREQEEMRWYRMNLR